MEFRNQHSDLKDRVHKSISPLHYFSGSSDKVLHRVRAIFGLESDLLLGPQAVSRCTTSTKSVRCYNFTRQEVVHTAMGGMRSVLLPIYQRMTFADPEKTKGRSSKAKKAPIYSYGGPGFEHAQCPQDIYEVVNAMVASGFRPENQVVIAQYFRIVAIDMETLREAVRSLAVSEDMIHNIEIDHGLTVPQSNGLDGFYRDILIFTTIDEVELFKYRHVLDRWSGEQFSFDSITKAPAHIHDERPGTERAPNIKSFKDGKSAMATIKHIYGQYAPARIYAIDCGIVVEVPQTQDLSKKPGVYRTWYQYDHAGRIIRQTHFTPQLEAKPHNGFFQSVYEATLECSKRSMRIGKAKAYSKVQSSADAVTRGVTNAFNAIMKTLNERLSSATHVRRKAKERKSSFRRSTEESNKYAKIAKESLENLRLREVAETEKRQMKERHEAEIKAMKERHEADRRADRERHEREAYETKRKQDEAREKERSKYSFVKRVEDLLKAATIAGSTFLAIFKVYEFLKGKKKPA